MPIIERDPWRQQYFLNVDCPEHVNISTDDRNSYQLYPNFRWVYDKTNLCKTQNILHAPAGIKPPHYPVFSKPITNLRGMGVDSFALHNDADYFRHCKPGCFWMELLTGEHISTDFALIDGEVVWHCHVQGHGIGEGTFDYWHISPSRRPALEAYCRQWLRENLSGFTGMVNFETIGGKIIEVHLRLIDQWPDLYGKGWLDAVVRLYNKGCWSYACSVDREAYSVVLFGLHERSYAMPPDSLIHNLKNRPFISSIQITFDPQGVAQNHAMPPGGFRLAIVNCYDLVAGLEVRQELAKFFDIKNCLPVYHKPHGYTQVDSV